LHLILNGSSFSCREKGIQASKRTYLRELSVLVRTLRVFSDLVETTERRAKNTKYNILIESYVTDETDPRETRGRVVRTLYYEMNNYAKLRELRERIGRRLGFPASHIYMENWRHQYYNADRNEDNEVQDFWCYKGVYVMPTIKAHRWSRNHEDEPYRYVPELMHSNEEAVVRTYPMMRLINTDKHFSTVRSILELPFEPADEQYDIFQTMWDLV